MEGELGIPLPEPSSGSIDTVELSLRILSARRPLFLTDFVSDAIPRRLATYPIGTAIRVLPPGESPPPPVALEQANDAVFSHFAADPARGPADDDSAWALALREAYARPWLVLAHAYEEIGRPDAAERSRRRARSYAP
jgi:hypothetical protein